MYHLANSVVLMVNNWRNSIPFNNKKNIASTFACKSHSKPNTSFIYQPSDVDLLSSIF